MWPSPSPPQACRAGEGERRRGGSAIPVMTERDHATLSHRLPFPFHERVINMTATAGQQFSMASVLFSPISRCVRHRLSNYISVSPPPYLPFLFVQDPLPRPRY